MSSNFTYEDVMNKAASYGLLDSMSEADRNLTMKNPDAGMTILNSRYDYKNATTDDARALAHTVAERTRMQYGGYSGGDDGSSFYVTDISPRQYTYDEAPSFNSAYKEQQNSLADKVLGREDYSSSFGEMQGDILKQIKDTADYSYDPSEDDAYAAYAKQYRREGQRATADVMGNAALLTGGIPSSAAVTAASQAGQYYATQLADKLPALEEAAYARNADRQAMLLNALSAAQSADNTAYQRYLDDIGLDYDNIEMLRTLENDDYVKYRDALAQFNTDRDFGYQQFVNDLEYNENLNRTEQSQENYENELELQKQQYQKELEMQEDQYREELSQLEDEKLWNAALYAVEYLNDTSLLKKLIAAMKGNVS